MEKIIVMIDESEAFSQMFSNYVNSHHILPVSIRAFTDWEAYLSCASEFDVKLILSSDIWMAEYQNATTCEVVWLSEKPSDPGRNIVNRYQGAERLSKEIISRLSGHLEFTSDSKRSKLTVFYAPVGGAGTTTAALAYSWWKGQSSRVLFINLEACSGLDILRTKEDKNFSDAMFYFLEDPENCMAKLVGCTLHRMELNFIPPTTCFQDLEELGAQTILEFLNLLRDPSLYDEIVVDLGDLVKEPLRVLTEADQIVAPMLRMSVMQHSKWKEWEDFLQKSIYTNLLNHCTVMDLPYMEDLAGRSIGWDGVTKSEWKTLFQEAGL